MEIVGSRILKVFAQPWVIEKKEVPVAVSLGLAVYPIDSQEIDGLFTSAKAAMECAREAGGNRYCFPSLQAA
jgi:GGDEF domain-containing protein